MLLPHGVPGNLLQTSLLVTSQRSRNICFTDQPLVFRLHFSHLNLFIPLPTGLFGASVLSHYVLWTVCTLPPISLPHGCTWGTAGGLPLSKASRHSWTWRLTDSEQLCTFVQCSRRQRELRNSAKAFSKTRMTPTTSPVSSEVLSSLESGFGVV